MKSTRLGALLLIAALSCSKSPTAPAADYTITVADFAYTPDSLNVQVGKVVEWINNGPSAHTVTSDSAKWTSRSLSAPGGGGGYGGGGPTSTQITFTTAGRFPYHCTLHGFTGVIIVGP
jgi:plastocyanin